MQTCKLERRKRRCQYEGAGLDQLLMEFQKLVLVVLQKLKVDFQRAQSVFASCACIDNNLGNQNISG